MHGIVGRHTCDLIAKTLEGINREFEIGDKICFTVTDSGSNFLKALQHYALEESEEMTIQNVTYGASNDDEEKNDDDDMEFEQIDKLLSPPNEDVDEEPAVYQLSPHRKCTCHKFVKPCGHT